MRTSKKTEILQAAIAIIDRSGVEAVTYESLASESGLSKSGLVYHFPSRHELMVAIHQYMADLWEQELIEAAGKPAAEISAAEQLRAYVKTLSAKATNADLNIAMDSKTHPDFVKIWGAITEQWAPDPGSENYLVKVLADGLWLHDIAYHIPLTPKQRLDLTERILAMVPDSASGHPSSI